MSSRVCLALGLALAAPVVSAADRGTAFNPKISLILDSQYAEYRSTSPADIAGVLRGPDSDPAPAGFSLGETELVVESNIDDQWHGWVTLSLDGNGAAAVEEAYANTWGPWGTAAKVGRFKSEIGYQNHIHAHAWDFADAPLVYRAMLNGQLQDDGVQVRWVAPTDLLFEIGAEAFRGAAFPAGGKDRDGINAFTGFLHLGGDAGEGGSWRLGASHFHGNADNRVTGEAPDDARFNGANNVSIADFVFKWAPGGNVAQTNVVFVAEYFHGDERGDLVFDPSGAAVRSDTALKQDGAYAQLAWQFRPRWRVGARYDWLSSQNAFSAAAAGNRSFDVLADNSRDPQRGSVMVDFSNSEFSRIRVQYERDASRPRDERDDQVYVQFIYSLGAHPAHQY